MSAYIKIKYLKNLKEVSIYFKFGMDEQFLRSSLCATAQPVRLAGG
jgi:hypothetical protein